MRPNWSPLATLAFVALLVGSLAGVGDTIHASRQDPVTGSPSQLTTGFVGGGTDAYHVAIADPGQRIRAGGPDADRGGPEPVVVIRRIVERGDESPEKVTVTMRYTIPATVTRLGVRDLPTEGDPSAAVVGSDGFSQTAPGQWVWDDGPAHPTITIEYTLPRDRLTQADHGTAGEDWAFVSLPAPRHPYRYTGQKPTFELQTRIRGNGTGTDTFAFVGAYENYTRTAAGQTFHLYVPERANLAEDPETLLGYYVEASKRLRIAGRDEHVYGFAIPSADRTVSPVGLTRGGNSFYVAADAEVGGDETWVHEYVHTRQAFTTNAGSQWLLEASASYYGIVLRAHSDDWTEDRLYNRIGGNRHGTLTNPSTWVRLTPYVEGRKFLAHLNLRLREATGGNVSVTTVVADLNSRHGKITHESVVNAIAAYDESTATWADATLRSGESLSTPREPGAYLFHGSAPDGDGLNLTAEHALGTSPFSTDTDGDGLPDDRDDCPTTAGDGGDGCPATATETSVVTIPATPTETTTETLTEEPTVRTEPPSTDATGPVGPAPYVAVVVVALAARSVAHRR